VAYEAIIPDDRQDRSGIGDVCSVTFRWIRIKFFFVVVVAAGEGQEREEEEEEVFHGSIIRLFYCSIVIVFRCLCVQVFK
jgi:hypothetical protein